MTKELAIQILRGEVLGANEQTHEAVFMAIKALKNEQKHGRWVLITNKYIDPQEYACSVCGRIIKYYGIPELLCERYPYCNCGAQMERSEE